MADTWGAALARRFGANLTALRSAVGITQQEFADRTEGRLSRAVVANIEAGRQLPRLDQVMVVAQALAIPLQELFAGLPSPWAPLETDALEVDPEGRRFLEQMSGPRVDPLFREPR